MNLPRFRFPERLPKFRLEDFAGPRLGERLSLEDDLLGALVACDEGTAMLDDVVLGGRMSFARDDDCSYGFAPALIRDADDGCFEDTRMFEDSVFDLGQYTFSPPGNDHVFSTVDDVNEVLVIDGGDIAGVHPSVSKYLFRGVRALPITLHDVRTAGYDLAGVAELDVFSGLKVDDPHLNSRDLAAAACRDGYGQPCYPRSRGIRDASW
ncbi:MAG: hypothetical protein R3B97_01750 [Dehalococcoidia bacterium]